MGKKRRKWLKSQRNQRPKLRTSRKNLDERVSINQQEAASKATTEAEASTLEEITRTTEGSDTEGHSEAEVIIIEEATKTTTRETSDPTTTIGTTTNSRRVLTTSRKTMSSERGVLKRPESLRRSSRRTSEWLFKFCG
jgi:hypothetical protein